MTKYFKIIYWVTTIWLALGMLSTGIVQVLKVKEEVENFASLGFPVYLMTIIGIWKILGVIAILMPRFLLLKEWAYGGFFFVMSGALLSHISSGHTMQQLFGPGLLLVLTVLSWVFRPASRRLRVAV